MLLETPRSRSPGVLWIACDWHVVAISSNAGVRMRQIKLSIGIRLREGSWGGGNQAMRALAEHLSAKGAEVSFDLTAPDLDILLLIDPRRNSLSASYADREIFAYLKHANHRALVVHRVNECDERKGTTGVNRRLITANLCADHTVFISTWLKELFLKRGLPCRSVSVILNGSDRNIFNPEGYERWDHVSPLRLVTHHWGGHWMKGFDIYERLDRMLADEHYRGMIEFTYIGNLPDGFRFRNATYIEPRHGKELAALIRSHHVYLTASRNEPGGNHQNEGANCGLPLLYRESGGIPESCRGFGLSFTTGTFEQKLMEMRETYDHWADRMKDYPHTAERMSADYHRLFLDLLAKRDDILKRREKFRKVCWSMRNLLLPGV